MEDIFASEYGDIGDSLADSFIGELLFPYSSLEPKWTKVFTFKSIARLVNDINELKCS